MVALEIQAFNESFERCMEDRDFFRCFYDIFLGISPEITEKFGSAKMERCSHTMLVSFSCMSSGQASTQALEHFVASQRSASDPIPPRLYDYWLDALLTAAALTDERFDAIAEAGWRRVMQAGISYVSRHNNHQIAS